MKQNNCSVQQTELVKPVNQIGWTVWNSLHRIYKLLQLKMSQNTNVYDPMMLVLPIHLVLQFLQQSLSAWMKGNVRFYGVSLFM